MLDELILRADRAALLSSLARGFAHDLRNPLQTLGLVPQLQLSETDPETAERLGLAVGTSLERLTRCVARFSQVYAPAYADPEPILVTEVLTAVQELQQYQRALDPIEVRLLLAHGLPAVQASEPDLQHVLLNLITNAKEALAGRPDGEIVVTAMTVGTGVEISVEDNGPGISADLEGRAFEPFVTTKPGGEGLGLGLAVARRLAIAQGATLRYETGAGGGARFVVRLNGWGERPA
ncbi:MAG: HAMP domain-containing sensor histidine kinase [Gemmatimonadota bacterium]